MTLAGRVALLLLLAGPLAAGGALAQEEPPAQEDFVDFVYAARLGTGAYSVGDRNVYILRMPFSFRFATPEERDWKVRLKLPLALGFYDYDLPRVIEDFDELPSHLSTVSLVPGVEFEVPIGKIWTLRPYAEMGAGKDLGGGRLIGIYGLGANSRLTFHFGTLQLSVGNEVYWAGSFASSIGDDSFVAVKSGIDFQHPLGFQVKGHEQNFSVFFIHTLFVKDLTFDQVADDPVAVENLFEVGLGFGMEPPAKLWKFKIPRIGIGFLFGEEFRGVRFSMGFRF